jgi:hypothetical protein
MRSSSLPQKAGLLFLAGAVAALAGCETGFGKPCKLPKSPAFRAACEQTASGGGADAGTDESIAQRSEASCAVKDYAGCETRVCLVYQGSRSYCSEECETDDDCEGSARCRSITGGTGNPEEDCKTVPGGVPPECYCVRKGDLKDESNSGSSGAAPSAAPTAAPSAN